MKNACGGQDWNPERGPVRRLLQGAGCRAAVARTQVTALRGDTRTQR